MNCSEFNQLLDLYVDGELNEDQQAEMKKHAAVCGDCREKLAAAEQIQEILSHLDDDISVPLPAQAAWRNAVRSEAKRTRMNLLYRACGTVAAVFVLLFGVTAMLRSGAPAELVPDVRRVETDGLNEEVKLEETTTLSMDARRMVSEYVEYIISSDDPAQAVVYLGDLVSEYGGEVERVFEGESENKIYVQIPGESASDFVSALNGIGTMQENPVSVLDEAAAQIGICVIIDAN